jgi:hypothetical protein
LALEKSSSAFKRIQVSRLLLTARNNKAWLESPSEK